MDVMKPKKRLRLSPIYMLLLGITALIVLMSFLFVGTGEEYKVKRDDVLLGVVKRGALELSVDGYGVLRSQKQTLITTLTAATVQEVVLRPGATVEPESVILRLSNPELMQEVESAKIALAQEHANYRLLKLSNQREILAEESILSEARAAYESASLRREAEEELAGRGVIAQITFKNTLLEQRQAKERLDFQTARLEQLSQVTSEAELIQKSQIDQAEAAYQTIKMRADRLTVKAGLKGVLQRLPVALGQSVVAGEELALVGSDEDLSALIRVSQARAELLRIGQVAQINTRRESAGGQVTRITPEVQDGSIEVEISFTDGVPASARPELNVDARIFVTTIEDSLYVERPVNVLSNTVTPIYVLSSGNSIAKKHDLRFGEDSGRYIQVLSGVAESDRIILSDTANYRNADRLQLID